VGPRGLSLRPGRSSPSRGSENSVTSRARSRSVSSALPAPTSTPAADHPGTDAARRHHRRRDTAARLLRNRV